MHSAGQGTAIASQHMILTCLISFVPLCSDAVWTLDIYLYLHDPAGVLIYVAISKVFDLREKSRVHVSPKRLSLSCRGEAVCGKQCRVSSIWEII